MTEDSDRFLRILLLATCSLFFGVTLYGQTRGGGLGSGPREQTPSAVVATASVQERILNVTTGGRLRPALSVPHAATANGIVTEIHVQIGDQITANTPLFTIERDEAVGSYAPVVVRARVPGVVSQLAVRLWHEVRAGEAGAVIIDPNRLILDTYISDKDITRVTPGMVVEAVTAEGHSIPGTLVARSPEPDYQTGLYRLRFEFTPTLSEYLPGRFVTVDLPVVRLEGVFVPQDVLVRRYGQYYIWVATEKNTLRLQQLSLGVSVAEEILVTSGLQPGIRYLRNPTGREREGMPVPDLEAGS